MNPLTRVHRLDGLAQLLQVQRGVGFCHAAVAHERLLERHARNEVRHNVDEAVVFDHVAQLQRSFARALDLHQTVDFAAHAAHTREK